MLNRMTVIVDVRLADSACNSVIRECIRYARARQDLQIEHLRRCQRC